MSKKKNKAFNEFLVQDGYLIVFTLVSAITLFSYFYSTKLFSVEEDRNVLGSTALRGVWVDVGTGIECPEMRGLDVDGCVTSPYFDQFDNVNVESVSFNSEGKITYTNEDLYISGIFYTKKTLNNDVWRDVYIGDINFKINNRQWVYEDVVWNKAQSPIVDIVTTDDGYIVIFYPSITLTSRTKHFWVFEYNVKDDLVRNLSFKDSDGDRSFLESSYVSVLNYEGDIFLRFDRVDPSLMGNKDVRLYRFNSDLELYRSVLLLEE
jgi:hypothetical protein